VVADAVPSGCEKRSIGGDVPDSEEESGPALIVEGKRRRFTVDYKALNQQMFGDLGSPDIDAGVKDDDAEEDEDDEVWSPRVQALKARKRKQFKGSEEASEDNGDSGDDEKQEAENTEEN